MSWFFEVAASSNSPITPTDTVTIQSSLFTFIIFQQSNQNLDFHLRPFLFSERLEMFGWLLLQTSLFHVKEMDFWMFMVFFLFEFVTQSFILPFNVATTPSAFGKWSWLWCFCHKAPSHSNSGGSFFLCFLVSCCLCRFCWFFRRSYFLSNDCQISWALWAIWKQDFLAKFGLVLEPDLRPIEHVAWRVKWSWKGSPMNVDDVNIWKIQKTVCEKTSKLGPRKRFSRSWSQQNLT